MRNGGFARAGNFGRREAYSLSADVRASFAAEADEGRRDWLGTARTVGLVAAVLAVVLLYVLVLSQVQPFRYWDAVCVVTVAILPTEVALACFFAQDHPIAVAAALARASTRLKGPRDWFQLASAAFVFGIMLPASCVLYLNQVLDRAPAVSQDLVVQRVWSRTHKHGTTWYAGVAPTARPPLRFASFYADQPIVVPRRTWRTLEPGRSTLTLLVHPGLLGLAWYEAAPQAGATNATAQR